jgi:hypothetical protein
MSEEADTELGNNLFDSLNGDDSNKKPGTKKAPARAKSTGRMKSGIQEIAGEKRTWIVVEDNPDIPPSGLPLSVNGDVCVLMPGEPVHILGRYLEVLDHAITSVPQQDSSGKIIGHRQRHRFPYRTVDAPAEAE